MLHLCFFVLCEMAMTGKQFDIDSDDSNPMVIPGENGDRRKGVDRRLFSYNLHLPERRCGKDRRSGKDRRKIPRIKI